MNTNENERILKIDKLKRLLVERSTPLTQTENYNFTCINSSQLLEHKLKLTGHLCLHSRNYKTILCSENDWIYCEFAPSRTSPVLTKNLLCEIVIEHFNVCLENVRHSANLPIKQIFYLQADFSESVLRKPAENVQFSFTNRVCIDSYLKTKLLCEEFLDELSEESQFRINDTFEDESDEHVDPSKDLNRYLFKVVHIGALHSLVNSQFELKLRAELRIELLDTKAAQAKTHPFILMLMSKFLFYYNFLRLDQYYLLKTSHKSLSLSSDKSLTLLLMEDSMKIRELPTSEAIVRKNLSFFKLSSQIIKEITPDSLLAVTSNDFASNSDNANCFLNSITGVLVEKKLCDNCQSINSSRINSEKNEALTTRFDVMFPNREFKLVLRLKQSNVIVTVYFETRLSIYSLCILPGMEITIFNLIKKSSRVYKSSSSVFIADYQAFDFLMQKSLTNQVISNSKNLATKKSLYESLQSNLSQIFNVFFDPNSSSNLKLDKDIDRFGLLFGQNYSSRNCSERKFLAQITKIYDLTLRIKCVVCDRLLSACCCCKSSKIDQVSRVEIETKFLIDDHTSVLKLAYKNSNYSFAQSNNQSNFFNPISNFLNLILKSYLNEIDMIEVPLWSEGRKVVEAEKLYQVFRDKLNQSHRWSNNRAASSNISTTMLNDNTLFGVSESYIFESKVKLDIYKALYDYLVFTILDKYFVFYVDLSDTANTKEMVKCRMESKIESNHLKLSEFEENKQQFKSSYVCFKCVKFVPAYIEFD